MTVNEDLSKDVGCLENPPPPSEKRMRGYSNPVFVGDLKIPSVERVNEKECPTFNSGGEEPTKEYEPSNYCTSERPTTYYDTFFHLLKATLGTGVLAVPSAFRDAGYSLGVGCVLFMALMYTCCIHLLVQTEYELCRRRRVPNMTYAKIVHVAFEEALPKQRWLASGGQLFANFFFVVYESGSCAIYIVFISSNLKQLLDYYLQDDISVRLIMFYVTIPMILVCWIRNLKLLAPLSAVANFITIVCFGLVFYYIFRELPTFEGKQSVGKIEEIPVYLTTMLFAISCTGVIMPLKTEMKKSAQFGSLTGVLNMAMIPMTILCTTFGFFGYLKYGDRVEGSITLNLPQTEFLAQCIKGLYSLSVFISYHLSYYVVMDIVWKNYLKDKIQNNNFAWEYVVRTTFSILMFLMAYAIPHLEIFISLVGSLGMTTNSLVIPVLMHTLVFWNSHKTKVKFYTFFLRNATLFSISLVIFVTGITLSVRDVIKMYNH